MVGGDRWPDGKPVPERFRYASETNPKWLSVPELRTLIGAQLNG